MENTNVDAIEAAHLERLAKMNRLLELQDGILQLIAEREQLDLPYSSEFWKAACLKINDSAQLDARLAEAESSLTRCREITAQQKCAAGK